MFLDPNLPDFLIWKEGGASVTAKFRIVGLLQAKDGRTYQSHPQPRSFDTSKATDPTRGALSVVQIQTIGLNLDKLSELKDLEVRVEAGKGQEVEHFRELGDEQALEYGSRFPLVVMVKNWKLNKQTTFFASIEKMPHRSLPDEVVFLFKVEKREERLEVLTDHLKFEVQEPKPENGDGDGHKPSQELDDETKQDLAGEQLDHGARKHGRRMKRQVEIAVS